MLYLMTLVVGSFVKSAFFSVYLIPFIAIMAFIGVISLIWGILKVR